MNWNNFFPAKQASLPPGPAGVGSVCQRVDYGREPVQWDDDQHKTRDIETKDPDERDNDLVPVFPQTQKLGIKDTLQTKSILSIQEFEKQLRYPPFEGIDFEEEEKNIFSVLILSLSFELKIIRICKIMNYVEN